MINDDQLRNIEKLHEMKAAGMLSEEEFASAKQDLLQGNKQRGQAGAPSLPSNLLEPSLEDQLQWALMPLRRYAQFEGRSSRREYWLFQLMVFIVLFVLFLMATLNETLAVLSVFSAGIGLIGITIPTMAVQVRRFHDQNKSGWFALLNLIPFGGILVLIFMLQSGTDGENQYGPDPRAE